MDIYRLWANLLQHGLRTKLALFVGSPLSLAAVILLVAIAVLAFSPNSDIQPTLMRAARLAGQTIATMFLLVDWLTFAMRRANASTGPDETQAAGICRVPVTDLTCARLC